MESSCYMNYVLLLLFHGCRQEYDVIHIIRREYDVIHIIRREYDVIRIIRREGACMYGTHCNNNNIIAIYANAMPRDQSLSV